MINKLTILSIVILFLIFQSLVEKSWSKPADWYLLWSSFLIGFSVLFAYPDYDWKMVGLLWWLLSCGACAFGSRVGELISPPKVRIKLGAMNVLNYDSVLFLYFTFGILYTILLLRSNGFSISSIKSVSDLYRINNYMQAYRYSKMDGSEGIIQQTCLSFTYALPICGGLILVGKKNLKEILKSFICLFPNFLISVINNTKSGIIIAVILFVSAYIVGYLMNNHTEPKLSPKLIKIMIVGVVLFLGFCFFVIRLRYNSDSSRRSSEYIISTIRDYIFGCTLNFDYYFSSIRHLDLSIPVDYFDGSNILTANAFWIHRYGYCGTVILWWTRGFFSGMAYKNVKEGSFGIIEILILLFVYLNAVYFFTYIPFSYTTVCIGVFFLFPVFFIIYRNQVFLSS